MRRLPLCLLALSLASAVVHAQDLKPYQEDGLERFNQDVQTNLDALNKACGTQFTRVQSDFENYVAEDFRSMKPGQVCQGMLLGVQLACGSAAYKKAVAKRLKGLACVFKGVKRDVPTDRDNAREKANLELKDGVFYYRMSTDHGGTAIAAKKVLEAALDK